MELPLASLVKSVSHVVMDSALSRLVPLGFTLWDLFLPALHPSDLKSLLPQG